MVVDVLCRASTQGGAESQMNTATTLTTDHDRTIIAHKNKAVALQGNIIDRDAGMNGAGVGEDVSFTLNTVDRHGVAYDTGCLTPGEAQEQRCYSADAPEPTLQSRECGGGQGKSFVQKAGENVQPKYIVRRLMPVECGRLQGFPDGWGEIEQLAPDMPEETAAFWRRVYETDCAIKGKRPQKSILEKPDKLAAWHNGLHTDSAEYKMWGNGMALPNALFFVQRAVARVAIDTGKGEANVKLGSMFDGSGTMPLCAAMCGARPVWASEVEPYPIAVTKTHLPEMKHLGSVTDRGYDPAYTMKIRSGCEGGGRGALVQNDLSATLATHQDQTVFAPRAFSFDSLASNSMKSANPYSGCREVDTAKTLDCGTPDPNRNQGGIAIVQKGSADEQ